jgi:hypothetical protein
MFQSAAIRAVVVIGAVSCGNKSSDKVNGELRNVELSSFANMKDPAK